MLRKFIFSLLTVFIAIATFSTPSFAESITVSSPLYPLTTQEFTGITDPFYTATGGSSSEFTIINYRDEINGTFNPNQNAPDAPSEYGTTVEIAKLPFAKPNANCPDDVEVEVTISANTFTLVTATFDNQIGTGALAAIYDPTSGNFTQTTVSNDNESSLLSINDTLEIPEKSITTTIGQIESYYYVLAAGVANFNGQPNSNNYEITNSGATITYSYDESLCAEATTTTTAAPTTTTATKTTGGKLPATGMTDLNLTLTSLGVLLIVLGTGLRNSTKNKFIRS